MYQNQINYSNFYQYQNVQPSHLTINNSFDKFNYHNENGSFCYNTPKNNESSSNFSIKKLDERKDSIDKYFDF